MSELNQVLTAIDIFEEKLGFTAPELIPDRIDQLRSMVRGVFEDGEDEDAPGSEPGGAAPELAAAKPDLRTAWRLADERLALLGEILGHPGIGQVPAALRDKWRTRAGLPS